MTVFADTSALYAVLDRDDELHEPARTSWGDLLSGTDRLLTSNYVVLESFALIQNRLGMEALQAFTNDMLPVVEIIWITEEDHGAAVQAVLAADRRDLSLVDCSSFVLMRRLALRSAFTFDRDFKDQGFEVRPD